MPCVAGDGWICMDDVDDPVPWDEPLLEYIVDVPSEIAQKIGKVCGTHCGRRLHHTGRIWQHSQRHCLQPIWKKASGSGILNS